MKIWGFKAIIVLFILVFSDIGAAGSTETAAEGFPAAETDVGEQRLEVPIQISRGEESLSVTCPPDRIELCTSVMGNLTYELQVLIGLGYRKLSFGSAPNIGVDSKGEAFAISNALNGNNVSNATQHFQWFLADLPLAKDICSLYPRKCEIP